MTSAFATFRDRDIDAPTGGIYHPHLASVTGYAHLASVTGCPRSLFPCGYVSSLRPPAPGMPSTSEPAWLRTNDRFHACLIHRLDREEP